MVHAIFSLLFFPVCWPDQPKNCRLFAAFQVFMSKNAQARKCSRRKDPAVPTASLSSFCQKDSSQPGPSDLEGSERLAELAAIGGPIGRHVQNARGLAATGRAETVPEN
ncbi:hypothetical protein KBY30_00005 [Ruegeria pomeroyi]|nr:hypothetical protein [Ruegeria pomeroyi]